MVSTAILLALAHWYPRAHFRNVTCNGRSIDNAAAVPGSERFAHRHAELGAVWVPIVVAHACAEQRRCVQLAATFFVADSCAVGVAEPEPDI